VDIDDLSRLESFVYEAPSLDKPEGAAPEEPEEFWEDTAATIQEEIARRAWPAHLGMAHGIRALNGRAKLAPARQVAALMPLAEELRFGGMGQEALDALFFDRRGLGARTLALHGIPVIADREGRIHQVGPELPRCYSPAGLELEAEQEHRLARLLSPDFEPTGDLALVEEAAREARPEAVADVRCDEPGQVQVDAAGEAVIVLRERHHQGWRVADQDGTVLVTFPINQVHTAVRVGPGQHSLTWRFEPPGLRASWTSAAVGWLGLILVGLFGAVGRREER
jgi:hypothetical protein